DVDPPPPTLGTGPRPGRGLVGVAPGEARLRHGAVVGARATVASQFNRDRHRAIARHGAGDALLTPTAGTQPRGVQRRQRWRAPRPAEPRSRARLAPPRRRPEAPGQPAQ